MPRFAFTRNDWPTLGVEIEFPLIDPETYALKNAIHQVLENVSAPIPGTLKPEMKQSMLEINTDVCRNVGEAEEQLRQSLAVCEDAVERAGARLAWLATHPFSHWMDQETTPNDRYLRLLDNLQDTARRLMTCGLHVHVGVDSGDKAIMIIDRLFRHLPTLLALSANSPYWNGRNTGLHSQRIKIMESLPTSGLPPLMRNWSEYVWLINHLIETNFISTIREIWWDVRPHHEFGTVEVRICDTPKDLETVLGITALIQCLVHALSNEIDEGTYQFDCHPMMVRQNKWRACRYGMDALLVDPYSQETRLARQVVTDLVDRLESTAEELDCTDYLRGLRDMAMQPTGSQLQLDYFAEHNRLEDIVRHSLTRKQSE